jgi:hypothetical protein
VAIASKVSGRIVPDLGHDLQVATRNLTVTRDFSLRQIEMCALIRSRQRWPDAKTR